MKTAKSLIVVLCVLLTAQIASAYYCPSTGRWLSRDPIGEPGFVNLRAAGVVPKIGQVVNSVSLPRGRWIKRDVATVKTAPNSYAFVFNNPIEQYDLLGLDCPGCDYLTQASQYIEQGMNIEVGISIGPISITIGNSTSPLLFNTPCALRACAQHDQCYFQNQCSASSWPSTISKLALSSLGIPVSFTDCEMCNVYAVQDMYACSIGKDNNAGGPNYFCAKTGKFITIPGDFPTLKDAKCACCNK